jgi:hypothetical protein
VRQIAKEVGSELHGRASGKPMTICGNAKTPTYVYLLSYSSYPY